MVDIGTIGPRPCEKSLSKCLHNLNDKKITNKVTKLLLNFRKQIKHLLLLQHDPPMTVMLLNLIKQNILSKIPESLPTNIDTHLKCCLIAAYRNALYHSKHPKHNAKLIDMINDSLNTFTGKTNV